MGDLAPGQSHLNCEEAIYEEPKAGESEMEEEKVLALEITSIFATVEDPRIELTKQHQLVDILMIAVCGVICGAEG